MTEPRADYLDENPFTKEQIADIRKLISVIRELGGFGCIRIVIEKNAVRFIRLDSASVKYDGGER